MIRGSDRQLAVVAGVFVVLYYALRLAGVPEWVGDALYMFPPGLAAVLHLRRARRETGRTAWFFRLVGIGAGLWALADLLWTLAGLGGLDPLRSTAGPFQVPMETLFLGFLVPVVGGVALRPHPATMRRDGLALADSALLTLGLVFGFVRLSLRSQVRVLDEGWGGGTLLAVETLVLAVWTVGLWRWVEDADWKRIYGCITLFAAGYGGFNFVANGGGGDMPAPGGPLDLVWIVPFFFLAAAALPRQEVRCPRLSGWSLTLVAVPGPLVLDLIVDRFLPRVSLPDHDSHTLLLVVTSALIALAAAVRLHFEDRAATRAFREARASAEEEQRAERLAALSSLSAGVMRELEQAVEHVVVSARSAAEAMGDKGERAVQQAERAKAVVTEAAAALSLARRGPRRDVLLGPILEDAVSSAVEQGLGLRISLDGMAGLPPVLGDAAALRAAVLQLIRNSAQATPGGILKISAERQPSEVILRFLDDGPGVAAEHRHRIFDPFFTTRRVGDGVGLGLTLVHFVARDHRGSVVLEPSEAGALFVLRLPVWERRASAQVRADWPFAAAILAAAALASTLVLLPAGLRAAASQVFPCVAAGAAAAALGLVARRRQGRERMFWMLLAGGPAVWVLLQVAHFVLGPGALGFDAAWPLVAHTAAEGTWAAALLVRPDRKELVRPRWLTLLGAGAALCMIAYLYTYLVILPAPFAVAEPAVLDRIALARGALRAGLGAWAGILALRGLTTYWRALFTRLALVFAVWAVGHTIAGSAVTRTDYTPGAITDVGWVVPFLVLGALGLSESLSKGAGGPRAAVETASGLRSALSLAGLAAVPVFDILIGDTGWPGLDAARDAVTRGTVVVVGLLLAVREILAHREMTATRLQLEGARSQLRDAERRSRLVSFLGGAVHELAGHLSGITSFVRLLLAQPDLAARVRADLGRIQERTDGALRIIRNLTALARSGPRELDVVSVNEVASRVVEMRRTDFAQEGVRVDAVLDPRVPALPLDAFALQHALLGLVDNAALAVRRDGGAGTVTVTTRLEEGEVLLAVRDDGPGLPSRLLRSLSRGGRAVWTESGLGLRLASQVAEQHGGVLTGRNPAGGGAELEIQLPIVARSRQDNVG